MKRRVGLLAALILILSLGIANAQELPIPETDVQEPTIFEVKEIAMPADCMHTTYIRASADRTRCIDYDGVLHATDVYFQILCVDCAESLSTVIDSRTLAPHEWTYNLDICNGMLKQHTYYFICSGCRKAHTIKVPCVGFHEAIVINIQPETGDE